MVFRIAGMMLVAALWFTPALAETAPEKWATKSIFRTPESALYSADFRTIFVTNVNGRPTIKDGNGTISKLNPDGTVQNLKWVRDLDAPKGMAVVGDTLYVTDIDRLLKIDIRSGAVISTYQIPIVQWLNDVTVDNFGYAYVSDSTPGSGTIYRLEGTRLVPWLKNPLLDGVNGLAMHGNDLIAGVGSGKLYRIRTTTKEIGAMADLSKLISSVDGIVSDARGGWFVSDWKGRVVNYTATGDKNIVVDGAAKGVNAADIGFDPNTRTLLVPTFNDNRVIGYSVP